MSLSHTEDVCQGARSGNASENNSLAASFMYLRLREGPEKDYMKVRESNVGTGLQIVKTTCSLEGD